MISLQEENDLIDQLLAGKEQPYARLVDNYKSYAFTIALKILNNRSDAEEATQDAFIKAFNALKNFNRQARFSTWLYRIVFNTAVSYKRKARIHSSIEHHDREVEQDGDLERKDKQAFVLAAMDKLNEADRLAIQLFYIKEFSLDEVADLMGQNMNTLKVRIHRARQRLADELKKILKEEALTL
ncbi:MAG TPA: sigma-70 family RNA polymerase sigma factor [Cyclobacteriaceae bacterium]|nr:sigma-70 family RNA polymerase sigma factor [Cyclobacteriaceae bacterium]